MLYLQPLEVDSNDINISEHFIDWKPEEVSKYLIAMYIAKIFDCKRFNNFSLWHILKIKINECKLN